MHRTCTRPGLVGRSTGRSTVQRALLSGNGPGRPGRSTGRELCSLYPVSVDRAGQPVGSTVKKYDRWPVDRPVDRKGISALSSCQRADFIWGYIYPPLSLFSTRFPRAKILILSSVYIQVSKEFLSQKDLIFICFKGLKKSRKGEAFGIGFGSSFL